MLIQNNTQVTSLLDSIQPGNQTQSEGLKSSSNVFDQLIGSVESLNSTQVVAETKMSEVLQGNSNDTSGALIALSKAELQMSLAVSVRDKLIQGYQTITNMQI
jgi:flagellar hook-basal body complex protein FliE